MSQRATSRSSVHPPPPPPLASSSSSSTVANGSTSSRKRPRAVATTTTERSTTNNPPLPPPPIDVSASQGGGERKKQRTERSKQSLKPPPTRCTSQERTSQEPEDEATEAIPPPPSTRKIARFRDPRTAERARMQESPAPRRAARPLEGSDSEDESDAKRGERLFTPVAPREVPHLSFQPMKRPRPSAAPPPSPGALPPPNNKRRARKSRLGETVFDMDEPLPTTDTPVINKNRDMRKGVERRASFGKRGQRASGSFGRGDPSYPHSGVLSSSFYKHIPIDQPEPLKARWLISWCAKRAGDDLLSHKKSEKKSKRREDAAEVDKLLANIVDAFSSGVARGDVDTNVFGSGAASTSATTSVRTVRPHPINEANRQTQAKETAIIKRMRTEERGWNNIAQKTNDLQAETLEATKSRHAHRPRPEMKDAADWFQCALRLADDCDAATSKDVVSTSNFGDVEFEVDMLRHTAHQAHQYVHQTRRFLDGVYSSLAADLRTRDGEDGMVPPLEDDDDDDRLDPTALLATAATGPSRPPRSDPINMLRALAAADSKQQSTDAVVRAAAIPVVPAAPSRPLTTTPRRPATAATPRRASVYGRGTPGGKR